MDKKPLEGNCVFYLETEMDTSQQAASSLPLRCDRALSVVGSDYHRGSAGDNTTIQRVYCLSGHALWRGKSRRA